jgi:DNA-binding NtrC family response regulator
MSRILIAEDEDGLRMLLERQLARSGYSVSSAPDGLAALSLLTQEPFDLVISDMKMPRLDGMGLLREAQQQHLPVDFIILTGHGSLEGAVEAFKKGNVVDYLLKPLEDIRMLSRIVERALEARQLKAENQRLSSSAPSASSLEALVELTSVYLKLVLEENLPESLALERLENDAKGSFEPSLVDAYIRQVRQRLAHTPPVPNLVRAA